MIWVKKTTSCFGTGLPNNIQASSDEVVEGHLLSMEVTCGMIHLATYTVVYSSGNMLVLSLYCSKHWGERSTSKYA